MKVLDNIDRLRESLVFKNDVYYYVQVIQRKKDNPDSCSLDAKRYSHFVTSLKGFDRVCTDVTRLCNLYNARAYISVVPRSLERFGKLCCEEYLNRIKNNDYKNCFEIPDRVAMYEQTIKTKGVCPSRLWMLDVDDEESEKYLRGLFTAEGLLRFELRTLSGVHMFVDAFSREKVLSEFTSPTSRPDDYVHENVRFTLRPECLTLLYAVVPG